jgi:hypothetical protein
MVEGSFRSNTLRPNIKFIISKFLTLIFKHYYGTVTTYYWPAYKKYVNYWFPILRQNLIDLYHGLRERRMSTRISRRNRKTSTYMSFKLCPEDFTDTYIGFYIPCRNCFTPVANLRSACRWNCPLHHHINVEFDAVSKF